MDQLRLFVAVRPSGEACREIASVAGRIAQRIAGSPDGRTGGPVRWLRTENYHLTLHFLGDTPPDLVPSVQEAMSRLAVQVPEKPELRLASVDAFPSAGRPRTLILRIDEAGQTLTNIAEQLRTALIGPKDHGKPFQAHVTLGYVRRNAPPDERRRVRAALESVPVHPVSFRAGELILVRSDLSPGGSRYADLFSVELSPTPPA